MIVDHAGGEIRVTGDVRKPMEFELSALEDFPKQEVRCSFVCSSGGSVSGRWSGVAISYLLSSVEVDPEVTHLVFSAGDGHQVCVSVMDALDGVLALRRLDSGAEERVRRFVAPGLEAGRAIKDVCGVRAVTLDAGVDRQEFESLSTDG